MKKVLSYNTKKHAEIILITKDIEKVIKDSKVKKGTLMAYSLHTTLGLTLQESAEVNLCQDIIDQLTKIVDDDGTKYKHRCALHPSRLCKTDDINGPSHVRQMMTNQTIILDIENGKLTKGQFQDIGLVELDGPRDNRKILIKILKD
jgi:secondary thiamine-phosphate synthase enzyme